MIEQVGSGSFAQIFKAKDTYVDKEVAIKVLVHGCEVLGSREGQYLQYLNRKTVRGSKYFIKLLDLFYFDKHVCITLELFKATLVNFMHIATQSSTQRKIEFGPDVKRPIARSPYAPRHVGDKSSVTSPSSSSLSKLSGHVDINKLRKIALHIISALSILRRESIIHADIKPENIFLTWNDTCHLVPQENKSSSLKFYLSDLPENFEVRIGDFGNSIQQSESCDYYKTFEIQTMQYRAPEVLMGLPFGPQVDMWSVGLVLMELWTGQPFFEARTKEELYVAFCQKLSPLPKFRFASGLHYDYLEQCLAKTSKKSLLNFEITDHIKHIKRILCGSGHAQGINTPPDFVHFISLLLHPDPDERLSAIDALQHEFLTEQINIPVSLLESTKIQKKAHTNSISSLRKSQDISLKRAAAAAILGRPSPLPQYRKSPNTSTKHLATPASYSDKDIQSKMPLNFKDYQIPVSYGPSSSSSLSKGSPNSSLQTSHSPSKIWTAADSLMSITGPPRAGISSQQKSHEWKDKVNNSGNGRINKEKSMANVKRSWEDDNEDREFDWFDAPIVTGKRNRNQVNYAEDEA